MGATVNPTRSTLSSDSGRLAGVWFLLTFLFSIPALWFYAPVLHDHDYIVGGGDDTRVAIGAIFEIFLVIANIATAVVLFPVLRRQSEPIALGYVASRIIESADHRHGHHQPVGDADAAPGPAQQRRCLRGRHHRAIPARGAQLDVPARPHLLRRLRERPPARLPDVPLGTGAAPDGDGRARRRSAGLPGGLSGRGRRLPSRLHRAGPAHRAGDHLGGFRSAST